MVQKSGDEAEEGGFVWKNGDDAGADALSSVERAAFEFLVDAFEGVGGAQAALMGGVEGKERGGEAGVAVGDEESKGRGGGGERGGWRVGEPQP